MMRVCKDQRAKWAVDKGDVGGLRDLLITQKGYQPCFGSTILHYICANEKPEQLQLLPAMLTVFLDSKVIDIDYLDHHDCTPFHIACEHNHLPLLELLPHHGANPHRR